MKATAAREEVTWKNKHVSRAGSVTNSIRSEKIEISVKWDSSFCRKHTVASQHASHIPQTSSVLEEGPTWSLSGGATAQRQETKGQQPRSCRVEQFLSTRETGVGLKSSHFRARKWLLLSRPSIRVEKVYQDSRRQP